MADIAKIHVSNYLVMQQKQLVMPVMNSELQIQPSVCHMYGYSICRHVQLGP